MTEEEFMNKTIYYRGDYLSQWILFENFMILTLLKNNSKEKHADIYAMNLQCKFHEFKTVVKNNPNTEYPTKILKRLEDFHIKTRNHFAHSHIKVPIESKKYDNPIWDFYAIEKVNPKNEPTMIGQYNSSKHKEYIQELSDYCDKLCELLEKNHS